MSRMQVRIGECIVTFQEEVPEDVSISSRELELFEQSAALGVLLVHWKPISGQVLSFARRSLGYSVSEMRRMLDCEESDLPDNFEWGYPAGYNWYAWVLMGMLSVRLRGVEKTIVSTTGL